MKDKYREETNKDVYANDMCCGCGGSDGSYSDEYVKWLESEVKKLHIQNVSDLLIAWEQFKKANWYESEAVDVEKMLMDKFQAIYGR